MKTKFKTKFGTAMLKKDGYYYIKSIKEKNYDKLLHRLIWEDFYKSEIPDGFVIHHKNGIKHDNCVLNLQLMSSKDHRKLHINSDNHPLKNKSHSESTYFKMSEKRNSSNYFRVTKRPCKECKKGFVYAYQYYVNGKQKAIVSVDLLKLKDKVLQNGLIWKKIGDTIEI